MTSHLVQLSPDFSCYVGGDEGSSGSEGEARFIYKEIFEDNCYEIPLTEDRSPFIVDVGANIGLFTVFMKRKYPNAKVVAFEPAPKTYAILQQNLLHHSIADVDTYPVAISSENGTKKLTFYPNSPGNSTFYPEEKEDLKKKISEHLSEEFANMIYSSPDVVEVETKRLSSILKSHAEFSTIDLLKIDVEGAEFEVLNGIDEEDWHAVSNVTLEVRDMNGLLGKIEGFLQSRGFTVEKEVPEWGAPANFYMVTARRSEKK